MSKGSRSRERNAEAKLAKIEKEQAEVAKAKKNKLVTSVIAIVLVICVAAGVCVNQFYFANGQNLRNKVAVSSENVEVDGAMLLYFYNSTLNSYKTYYGGLMDMYLGIDSTKSLKNQMRSEGVSWFDSFMSETANALNEVIALYEDAMANGFTLTEEQKELIKIAQDGTDMSVFNKRLKKSDVDKCLELSLTATFYKQHLIDTYSYTEEQIKAAYDASPVSYQKISYRYADIEYAEDDTKTYMEVEANKKAVELQTAESEEKFVEIYKAALKEMYPELADDRIDNTVEAGNVELGSFTEGDKFSEWAYSADRKVGDTFVDRDNDGYFRVYYLTSLPEIKTYKTVNARHILLSTDDYSEAEAEQKANEIYAQWQQGEATEESFAKLASVHSSDVGSVYAGGLYKNITKGYMVEEFDAWIYDEARKAGDTAVIKTSYGWHVMYFCGEGLEAWQAEAFENLQSQDYSADIEELNNKYKATYVQSVVDKFPGIM